VFEEEIQDFPGFCEEKQSFILNQCKDRVWCMRRPALTLAMCSTRNRPQGREVRDRAISSNFDRRVHVVGGCREFPISPEHHRESCDRHWMSSSIRVISANFFLQCKSLSWVPFESGSQLSQLANWAFRESGLISIHLPASVTVIGESCFSRCRSLRRSHLNPAHSYLNLQSRYFLRVA
jgi:hypothetical protein